MRPLTLARGHLTGVVIQPDGYLRLTFTPFGSKTSRVVLVEGGTSDEVRDFAGQLAYQSITRIGADDGVDAEAIASKRATADERARCLAALRYAARSLPGAPSFDQMLARAEEIITGGAAVPEGAG